MKIIRATTIPKSLDVFCRGILKKLSEKYEVVALSSPGEEMQAIAEREGVRTITVPMERHISPWKDIVALFRLIQVFRQERPTMVHSMTPKAGLLCMVAAWLTRVPVRVHTFTGLVFPTAKGLQRKLLMLTDSITCRCATYIIPEGEGVKNDLFDYGITTKPLRVLGFGNVMGVDMHIYSRRPEVMEKARLLRDEHSFTFLFVGRIVRDKGINELCEAFDRLSKEYPQARLLLVGWREDALDPVSDETLALIDSNPSIDDVGEVWGDGLLAYYAAADCFVLPSYREGFPNTVLEAGAMGLPSIVTDINGSREIIVENENGMIVPPRDADALFVAMRRMINDDRRRSYMASNARNMIGCRFEQGFVRQCLFDFYDTILGGEKE
ncbi:MAG: glycosyltransferase family 4 protein [Prevotella sp.]|nr:glycosyltransferase family 4 protein [Prevotella sp.]